MNKYIFVLLAICLVSVHAFVKRDAPAPEATQTDSLEALKKQIVEGANNIGDNIKTALNPEQIKANFNSFVDEVSKMINQASEKKA